MHEIGEQNRVRLERTRSQTLTGTGPTGGRHGYRDRVQYRPRGRSRLGMALGRPRSASAYRLRGARVLHRHHRVEARPPAAPRPRRDRRSASGHHGLRALLRASAGVRRGVSDHLRVSRADRIVRSRRWPAGRRRRLRGETLSFPASSWFAYGGFCPCSGQAARTGHRPSPTGKRRCCGCSLPARPRKRSPTSLSSASRPSAATFSGSSRSWVCTAKFRP